MRLPAGTGRGVAPPAGACARPDPPLPPVAALPWAQRALDPPSVWRHSTGAGVLVAVVDSGVDSDHPQLKAAGTVLRGQDFHLIGDLPGNFDCVSHGTAVASLIAARPADGIGFAGLAPGARILPVRVSERELTDDGQIQGIHPRVLAGGIRYAADRGAKVINLSLAGGVDHPEVRAAVAHAVARDAVVVAAAGNGTGSDQGGPVFPAGYDGVLGVGAVDPDGLRLPSSRTGPQVDLVAPGGGVLAAARAGGHRYYDGTSFAAPFVAATAALVRAAWPELTAAEVAARIVATANPAPGGPGYGAGLVDPYRAVTDGLTVAAVGVPRPVVLPTADPAAVRAAASWHAAGTSARVLLVASVLLVALAALAGWVIRRGRRERWQARRVAVASDPGPDDEFLESDQLFAPPPAQPDR
ncbi:type VII secretion-associated serine protease mycosin [Solwaraspora sp. WMMD1047]|uniref:type VII secretion-associated serine protease mycosin n=1 Tax=Solwaraspora sp. WMMD1047 TaxID=3016102 RepID=UPI002417AC0B|nr:type VII secretion-associated serine protease mycosin [Solwaraspora sp. WMMD1047]MDG4831843.1 type VII secretion-associated serine protease mycosin [Solwaraspora sp. WMMD1047]